MKMAEDRLEKRLQVVAPGTDTGAVERGAWGLTHGADSGSKSERSERPPLLYEDHLRFDWETCSVFHYNYSIIYYNYP